MEKIYLQDLLNKDFEDSPNTLLEGKEEINKKKLEEIIEKKEWIYYGKRKEHKGEFFLPGETKFFPLERIDEKYEEYRRQAGDFKRSENSGFRVDYGILGLLKGNKKTIKQLQEMDFNWLEAVLYELGLRAIKMTYDFEDFDQEKFKKFLDLYKEILSNPYRLASMPEKRPSLASNYVSEIPELRTPETRPRQDYLENLLLEIKKEVFSEKFEVKEKNPPSDENFLDLSKTLGELRIGYDRSKCERDVVNEETVRCLESPKKYNECANAYHKFQTWQCCAPEKGPKLT